MEDLQNESYNKSQQLSAVKDKEIKNLEIALKAQFQEELKQYTEALKKLQGDLSHSKALNKEMANEMIKLTDENSSQTVRIKELESKTKVGFA